MPVSRIVLVTALALGGTGALRAQCPDGSPPPCGSVRAATAPGNSIAVLYFRNQSRDTSDAYLADGLTEAVATRLSRLRRLEVVSAAAVRRLRNSESMSTGAIGNVLRVNYLVSGTLRRAGNRVRVTAELLRASSGASVWAGQFDHAADDPFGVEEAVAESVSVGIAGRLLPAERLAVQARPTQNAAAYDHFLRGNYAMASRTLAGERRAVSEYEQAIALDARFSAAYARLAYTCRLLFNIARNRAARDSLLERGMAAANRSLALDSNSSDGWIARGYWLVPAMSDWPGTGDAYRRALVADARNAEAWHRYGGWLFYMGLRDSSWAALQRSLVLDPSRSVTLSDWSNFAWRSHEFALARRLADSAIALEPRSRFGFVSRWQARLSLGDTAGARSDLAQLIRILSDEDQGPVDLSAMYDFLGGDDRALRARALADSLDPLKPMVLGDRETALARFQRQSPTPLSVYTMREPWYDPLRSDPRFQRLYAEQARAAGVRP